MNLRLQTLRTCLLMLWKPTIHHAICFSTLKALFSPKQTPTSSRSATLVKTFNKVSVRTYGVLLLNCPTQSQPECKEYRANRSVRNTSSKREMRIVPKTLRRKTIKWYSHRIVPYVLLRIDHLSLFKYYKRSRRRLLVYRLTEDRASMKRL